MKLRYLASTWRNPVSSDFLRICFKTFLWYCSMVEKSLNILKTLQRPVRFFFLSSMVFWYPITCSFKSSLSSSTFSNFLKSFRFDCILLISSDKSSNFIFNSFDSFFARPPGRKFSRPALKSHLYRDIRECLWFSFW